MTSFISICICACFVVLDIVVALTLLSIGLTSSINCHFPEYLTLYILYTVQLYAVSLCVLWQYSVINLSHSYTREQKGTCVVECVARMANRIQLARGSWTVAI